MANVTKAKTGQSVKGPRPLHPNALTCRLSQAEALTGIGRTYFYELERKGKLSLIRIKPPGSRRGITLVEVDKLQALIDEGRKTITRVTSPAA